MKVSRKLYRVKSHVTTEFDKMFVCTFALQSDLNWNYNPNPITSISVVEPGLGSGPLNRELEPLN